VFIYDEKTHTWNINPIGSFVLTTDSPAWDSGKEEDAMDPDEAIDHACLWTKGSILRGILAGGRGLETGESEAIKIKQILTPSETNVEHYRYLTSYSSDTWKHWYRVTAYPKREHDQITKLVGIGSEYIMGGSSLSYQDADKVITNYGDQHYVSYDKETNLTNKQKNQARENIEAINYNELPVQNVSELPYMNADPQVLYRTWEARVYGNYGLDLTSFRTHIIHVVD
jgi:hypothetical protein